MKEIGLKDNAYNFSIDYAATDTKDIISIDE